MKIGELAAAAQCTTETIRFYEKKGLLPKAGRTEGNYRSYGQAHVERLRFIRNCRALDLTHDEIRPLLEALDQPLADCSSVNTLLDAHIGHVSARIAELRQLQRQLSALRIQCQSPQASRQCGILLGLADMPSTARSERSSHLG